MYRIGFNREKVMETIRAWPNGGLNDRKKDIDNWRASRGN